MKKIIKIDFENTTRERKTEDSYSELYSYDKNNGLFEFKILNDTLTTEQVTALFKFTESNKVWKTAGTVEGNKVNVTFDTSLITQNETVICYLYFDEEQRTSDTFRFKFKVKVSEIDKMSRYEVKERFINNTVIVDRLDVVTKEELKEALKNVGGIATEGLLTEAKAEEIYAKKSEIYDDTSLKQRVAILEERPDNNTVYDDSDLRGRVEALENRPDNNKGYDDTDLSNRVKALENRPTGSIYDDSDLQGRVRALEERPTTTAYDDSDVKNRLKAIEDTQISKETLKDYAKTSELPQPYNDKALSDRILALESKPVTEIHGTGMPNRVVEAPIGTTYIDTAKTNGVLKWIKTTDGWNTGWKVAEGDTGWRTLPLVNKRGNARLQIRRINDEVIVKFDGLQYGWFGVDDMEKQGGNIVNKTIGDKKYTWIKLNIGQGSNILPVGFRSTSSVLTGLYGDLGDLLGSVYVGSIVDQNAIQLRYAMEKNEITNTMLAQIRISPITFVTDDPWPTQLP